MSIRPEEVRRHLLRRSQQVTVIVIPQTDRHTLSFRLPIWVLGLASGFVAILTLVIAVGLVVFVRQYQEADLARTERELLRQETASKEQQLQQMTQRVRDIEQDLDRVYELERQVRQLLVQSDAGDAPVTVDAAGPGNGVGGPGTAAGAKTPPQTTEQRLFSAIYPLGIEAGAQSRRAPRVDRTQAGRSAAGGLDAELLDTHLADLRDRGSWLVQTLPQAAEAYRNKLHYDAHRPMGLPVPGRITDAYGWRTSPFDGYREWHAGIDLASDWDEPVRATAAGEVIFAGWKSGGYGYTVVIDHGYGFQTVYAHNNSLSVAVGDYVQREDVVALAGSTGRSTGPHVHYEVLIWGQPTDPLEYRH